MDSKTQLNIWIYLKQQHQQNVEETQEANVDGQFFRLYTTFKFGITKQSYGAVHVRSDKRY